MYIKKLCLVADLGMIKLLQGLIVVLCRQLNAALKTHCLQHTGLG